MTMWIHFVFLLTLGLAPSLVRGLVWVKTPQNQEVFPGRDVTLGCEVTGEFAAMQWLGKTGDHEIELLFIENKGQPAEEWKRGANFKIVNTFDLLIEVSDWRPSCFSNF